MNRYLMLFTIGPVQSFIKDARKLRDLYAGSSLLSELTNEGMKELESSVKNVEFIFPDKGIRSKPNRFVAELEADDPKAVGRSVEKKVRDRLKGIWTETLKDLKIEKDLEEIFKRHIDNHLEVYWEFLPLDEKNYKESIYLLESYMGSIKNLRIFSQMEEGGRKCSLCGIRNALFYREKPLPFLKEEEGIKIPNVDSAEMQEGEGLCGMGLLKRFWKRKSDDGKTFPSIAEIALMDTLNEMYKREREKVEEYKYLFGSNFTNYELFYPENLTEKYVSEISAVRQDKKMTNAQLIEKAYAKLSELYDAAKGFNLKFSKYYAVLMLDGDRMGKWIGGEYLEEGADLKEFQKELSSSLGRYAEYVRSSLSFSRKDFVVKNNCLRGRVVYAGGDDVLAFINLNYLFEVIRELREKFPKFEELPGVKKDPGICASASAGIVIAHYKTPLNEVLKRARIMEKKAKEEGGRNAFAIAVLKRSGETKEAIVKWQYEDSLLTTAYSDIKLDFLEDKGKDKNKFVYLREKDLNVPSFLEDILSYLKKEKLSNTFIYNLRKEFNYLSENPRELKDLFIVELKRLIERSYMETNKKESNKKKTDKDDNKKKKFFIYKKITNGLGKIYKANINKNDTISNVLSILEIVEFISREVNYVDKNNAS